MDEWQRLPGYLYRRNDKNGIIHTVGFPLLSRIVERIPFPSNAVFRIIKIAKEVEKIQNREGKNMKYRRITSQNANIISMEKLIAKRKTNSSLRKERQIKDDNTVALIVNFKLRDSNPTRA